MNWPYIHTLVNHFPIILSVVGCVALGLALITKRRGLWLYAVATLTLAGVTIYPADLTGDQAAHAVRGTWYIVRSMVEEHDDSATYALIFVLATGVVSAYAWWRMLRREILGIPPVWLRVVLTIVALFSLSVVIRTAYLGGRIVHDSPRLENPPPGMSIPPDTTRRRP